MRTWSIWSAPEAIDDIIYGSRGPVIASKSEAPDVSAMRNNQQQEDDYVYGYRNTGIAAKSDPHIVIPLQKNQQQEDDLIYGYRN